MNEYVGSENYVDIVSDMNMNINVKGSSFTVR
jgi:hypothetical protein